MISERQSLTSKSAYMNPSEWLLSCSRNLLKRFRISMIKISQCLFHRSRAVFGSQFVRIVANICDGGTKLDLNASDSNGLHSASYERRPRTLPDSLKLWHRRQSTLQISTNLSAPLICNSNVLRQNLSPFLELTKYNLITACAPSRLNSYCILTC